MAERYTTNETARTTRTYTDTDRDHFSMVAPMDRVRWSSVLAGLFTVLASLVVFSVLGIAIGLSTVDVDNPSQFGIGAGIYSAISAVLAFALGGFVAARTTAVAGSGNAILNGAMVWIVTIPLIVNVLTTGVGSLLGTATDLAFRTAETAATAAGAAAEASADQVTPAEAEGAANEAGAAINEAAQAAQAQVEDITPAEVEAAARDASSAAWATLLALGLSAGAAIFGGMMGRRSVPTDVVSINS
ncbi:MAG: hypothetical protein MUF87_21710 [Anaerolineae bacterium]|nr:hypothetical protein [Anaerolineae bacterium]